MGAPICESDSDVIVMRRGNKILLAVLISLPLGLALLSWGFVPCIGPLVGIQRTQEQLLEFAKDRRHALFVDPAAVLSDGNNSYHDWAYAETKIRIMVSSGVWLAGIIILGFWAAKPRPKKSVDNNRLQGIC